MDDNVIRLTVIPYRDPPTEQIVPDNYELRIPIRKEHHNASPVHALVS